MIIQSPRLVSELNNCKDDGWQYDMATFGIPKIISIKLHDSSFRAVQDKTAGFPITISLEICICQNPRSSDSKNHIGEFEIEDDQVLKWKIDKATAQDHFAQFNRVLGQVLEIPGSGISTCANLLDISEDKFQDRWVQTW